MTAPQNQEKQVPLAQPATTSIANRLLRIIFASYFGFTVLVTAIQLVAEYRHTEGRVNAEIQAMGQTFGPGIADAMWRFQDDVLQGILVGMNELPTVIGVKVLGPDHKILHAVGTIADQDGRHSSADLDGALSPLPSEQGYFARALGHEFAVVYVDENKQRRNIGTWVVYSNQRVVLEQVEFGFFLILVTAIVKAVALWYIFLYVVHRWLGQPLLELTEFVRQLTIRNLGEQAFIVRDSERHELHFLADTVNIAARTLRSSVEQNTQLYDALHREQQTLTELNETLERRVTDRTAQLQEANRQLAEMSMTDGLTGIANRRRFDVVLASEWNRAERLGQPLAIALLDVDWFKKYNDHYGHVAGDDCLRNVAKILTENVRRAGDLVARYGGEEFAIIVPTADGSNALGIAQSVCEAIRALEVQHVGSEFGCLTVSIGVVSMVPGKNDSPNALLQLADQALYRAKQSGRNRVVEDVPAQLAR